MIIPCKLVVIRFHCTNCYNLLTDKDTVYANISFFYVLVQENDDLVKNYWSEYWI